MKVETVRAIIALIVVGVVMITSAVLALVPILSDYEADRATVYQDFVETYTSIFAGVVGLIIGYYFGKRSEKRG